MDELKVCSFCGGNNLKKQSIALHRDFSRWIHCETCYSQGPMVYEKKNEKDAWNTRPTEDALRAENEALKARVAELENDMPLQKACEEIERLKETITELEKYISDHSEKE